MSRDAKYDCPEKFDKLYILLSEDGSRACPFECGWHGRKCKLTTHPCFITHGVPLYAWAEGLPRELLKSGEDDEICIPYAVWFNSPDFKSALAATLAAAAGGSIQFANMVTPPGRIWLVMLSAIAHVIGAEMPSGAQPMKAIYKEVRPRPRPAAWSPHHHMAACSHTITTWLPAQLATMIEAIGAISGHNKRSYMLSQILEMLRVTTNSKNPPPPSTPAPPAPAPSCSFTL